MPAGFDSFRAMIELHDDLVTARGMGSTLLLLPSAPMRLRYMLHGRFSSPGVQRRMSRGVCRKAGRRCLSVVLARYRSLQ